MRVATAEYFILALKGREKRKEKGGQHFPPTWLCKKITKNKL